jgi:transcriptional regulator with GAF, ATPase, and Fis domain
VVKLFKVKGSSLLMYRKKDQTLEIASSFGLSDEYLQKGMVESSKSITEVFESGKSVLIEEADFDAKLNYPGEARKEGILSILSVPLKLGDTILGFLRIYSSEKRSFDPEEMSLLVKFAEQGAQAVENAMSYERVRSDIEGMKQSIPGPLARKMAEQS